MERAERKYEHLDRLVEAFKEDSGEYRDLTVPEGAEEKRQLLRALMNIRPPRAMAEATLALQDEYLRARAEEKGVVTLSELPTLREAYGSAVSLADVLCLWQGDITRLVCDAIVNAANSGMLGCFVPLHNCIDNCIHSFAGVQLRSECGQRMAELRRRYGPDYEQPTGVPMLTDAYNLPARKVIHVVGPIVADELNEGLERDLAACYGNVLDLCLAEGLRSVAFCCLSTGVFRFPPRRAAEIATATVTQWLTVHSGAMDRVIFNVFNDRDRAIYEALLA